MPPIRVAATSPDTFVSIGQQGKPIFIAVRYETADEIAPLVGAYRAAYKQAGHAGEGKVFLRVPAYIAASDKRARAEAETSFMHFFHQQANLLADSARRAGVDGAERRAATAKRLLAMSYDDALNGTVLVGSPEAVSDKLHMLQAKLGLDGVLMELNCGGMIKHAQVKSALRLLCQKVMPRFH
jgi:alkanesulfonate monooxygenase SsuD/methylene tetrahydromethanopterin reductase-like flavin-dependent oxidoreductase (luciferase family)